MEQENDFISHELAEYQANKHFLEDELSLGLITFDEYQFQLELLNLDYKNLKKYKQLNS
jgi:hypothetical protein